MKKWLISLGVMLTLILLTVIPASAAGYGPTVAESDIFQFTISGIQDYDEISQVLTILNQERARVGLHPLRLDPTLTAYAMQRAAETSVYYSHTRPDTSNCFSIFEGVYAYTSGYGENIACGQSSAAGVMHSWMNSEGHRNNILKPAYNSVGLGCFYQPDGTKAWVQMFHSFSYTGYYSPAGKVSQNAVPIRIYRENLSFSVKPTCTSILFPGETTEVSLYLKNMGWSYATPTPATGGFTVSAVSDAITAGNRVLIAKKVGIATFSVHYNNGYCSSYYTASFSVKAKPTISAKKNTDGSITINIKNTSTRGALYAYDRNNKRYIQICTLSGRNSYTYYNAAYNNLYTFSVRDTVDGPNLSNTVKVDTTLPTPKAPTIRIKEMVYYQSPVITWSAVTHASNYEVYRATSKNGKYEKLGQVRTNLYTDRTWKDGVTYFYKVKAIGKDGKASKYSNALLLKLKFSAPKIKASTLSNGKIKISWAKINGANRYTLYRATSKNGKYTKMGYTSGTSYTHGYGKPGVKYYYKVVASHTVTKVKSAYSAVKSATARLARPTVSIKLSKNKPYLSWKKVSGATKYVVYRATSKNGKYVKLSTVTGTKYRNPSAKKGKTYYYKVYAVCGKSAGKSVASTVKRIKAK